MRNKKNIVELLIVIGIGIILFNLVGDFSKKIEIASKRLEIPDYNKYKMIIASLFTLFGVLIEWKKIIRIVTEGFCFSWSCFISAILFIIVPMIPWETMLNLFGIKAVTLHSAYIRTAQSILGGILLVRSFRKYEK